MIVPSSTSSSETERWGRTWLLALVLTAMALFSAESYWRSRGFAAAVPDTARLWAFHRSRASGARRPQSVIVGSSRTQFGIDLDEFAAATGWPKPIQLSLQGRSPLPVLTDLAADPSFAGLVLVGVNERILFQADGEREARAREWVVESDTLAVSPTLPVESWIGEAISSRLVFRSPELAPDRQLAYLQGGYALRPRERWVLADRSAKIDFDRVNPNALEERWLGRLRREKTPSPESRDAVIERLAESVEAIRARGGEVVLIRMPSSGRLGAMENRKFPRSRFWDVMVARLGVPAIHFADDERLRSTRTPDGSHIDVADVPNFTRALARSVLERVGPES